MPILANVGEAEIKGFELELKLEPAEGWFTQFGVGYLDAEYTDFLDPATMVDRSGNDLPHAPDWNLNGIVRYARSMFNGVAAVQLDGWWVDDQFFIVENTPELAEDSHGELNARISYRFKDDRVELALFAKNLTDEDYFSIGFDALTTGFGANIFIPNRPRRIGGQLIVNF